MERKAEKKNGRERVAERQSEMTRKKKISAATQLRSKKPSPAYAHAHPRTHPLTHSHSLFFSLSLPFRCIYQQEPVPAVSVDPDIAIRPLQAGDVALVLCCDGVCDVLSDEHVARIVCSHSEAADGG